MAASSSHKEACRIGQWPVSSMQPAAGRALLALRSAESVQSQSMLEIRGSLEAVPEGPAKQMLFPDWTKTNDSAKEVSEHVLEELFRCSASDIEQGIIENRAERNLRTEKTAKQQKQQANTRESNRPEKKKIWKLLKSRWFKHRANDIYLLYPTKKGSWTNPKMRYNELGFIPFLMLHCLIRLWGRDLECEEKVEEMSEILRDALNDLSFVADKQAEDKESGALYVFKELKSRFEGVPSLMDRLEKKLRGNIISNETPDHRLSGNTSAGGSRDSSEDCEDEALQEVDSYYMGVGTGPGPNRNVDGGRKLFQEDKEAESSYGGKSPGGRGEMQPHLRGFKSQPYTTNRLLRGSALVDISKFAAEGHKRQSPSTYQTPYSSYHVAHRAGQNKVRPLVIPTDTPLPLASLVLPSVLGATGPSAPTRPLQPQCRSLSMYSVLPSTPSYNPKPLGFYDQSTANDNEQSLEGHSKHPIPNDWLTPAGRRQTNIAPPSQPMQPRSRPLEGPSLLDTLNSNLECSKEGKKGEPLLIEEGHTTKQEATKQEAEEKEEEEEEEDPIKDADDDKEGKGDPDSYFRSDEEFTRFIASFRENELNRFWGMNKRCRPN